MKAPEDAIRCLHFFQLWTFGKIHVVKFVLGTFKVILTFKVPEFALQNAFLGHGTRFLGAVTRNVANRY